MSKKVKHVSNCNGAIDRLRLDAESGQIVVYDVKNFPSGLIPPGYLDKCSSISVAISGSGSYDYLIAMPFRPDKVLGSSDKVIDIDPVIFCFKNDSLDAYPTGLALCHQKYSGRTIPISGYEACTLEQTVNDLRTNIATGAQPLSAEQDFYLNTISRSIGKLMDVLGPQISGWSSVADVDIRTDRLPPDIDAKSSG